MSRFFINSSDVDNSANTIILAGDDVNHIKNVLRMDFGDKIILSDGKGTDYHASIVRYEKDRIIASIIDAKPNCTEPPVDITLFQGIPKSDKMDYILQKSVELGVNRIVPVITERTVVKFESPKDICSKTDRWQRICTEAAKQCNRGIIPRVEAAARFDKALELCRDCALSIIPYEKETACTLKDCIRSNINGKIAVFIGPEGGFTDYEISKAVCKGIKPVTLGPRIMRTETAGIAVMSILMYELGDI